MEEQGSAVGSLQLEPEVVLEGWMVKLSRSRQWQERYFIFSSNQILTYYHKPGESRLGTSFSISREAGCEISDLYVEQRTKDSDKESLYCISMSWSDDTNTVGSLSKHNDSFKDDTSFLGGMSASLPPPEPPSAAQTPDRRSFFKSPNKKPDIISRQQSAPTTHSSYFEQYHSSSKRTLSPSRDSKHKFKSSSTAEYNIDSQENSITSLGTPITHRRSRSWFKRENNTVDQNLPNPDFENYNSAKKTKGKKKGSGHNRVPSVVNMDFQSTFVQEYATIHEADGEKSPTPIKKMQTDGSGELERQTTDRISNFTAKLANSESVESPDDSNSIKAGQVTYEEKYAAEQEKLHHRYFDSKRKKEKKNRQRVVESTKIAVAASAAVGVGVLTAGVGIAAGLVFLGAAAAAGGTASAAEAGLKRKWQKNGKLKIATTSFEQAKLWKSSLDACLEVESLKQSTWGQLFMADGRKPTNALRSHDVELLTVRSKDGIGDSSSDQESKPKNARDLPRANSQANLFLKDRNFFVEAGARWRPLEGGWTSFLGPGAQSLRIFREEKMLLEQNTKKVARLAVGGSTCTPLKTHVVLHAQPLDAFMCLMSYARIPRSGSNGVMTPNSGQSASFRMIEKMDDHMDVVHLICRKLYLFPSWTEPRDFVLFRYWRYEPDGSYIICYESVEHPACPPMSGFVRGEMHQVCTIAPPKHFEKRKKTPSSGGPECMLTSVVQVDPKGWVPTKPMSFLSNQAYADAFGVSALLQILDIRDAIEGDRFLSVAQDSPQAAVGKHRNGMTITNSHEADNNEMVNYDLRYANRERFDSVTFDTLSGLESHPPPLKSEKWAEPDANSFLVRGPSYLKDRVKINAGTSIGRLVAVDLVLVDKPIYSGMSAHPTERIQLALQREKRLKELDKESDMPPFIFVVNILLPGPPFYHAVYYYAVDDMSTIDGSNGTGSSVLCNQFLFGESDAFRDKTFKLIPQIVEGNFMVRKAVGSTPAIMGTKLEQNYVRNSRFMEVILNCGSSAVATGVIRLSLGYAKTLMVDMGFLLEGNSEEVLPERIFGCARMKYPEFGKGELRKVEDPSKISS
jgi:hypothetical protein